MQHLPPTSTHVSARHYLNSRVLSGALARCFLVITACLLAVVFGALPASANGKQRAPLPSPSPVPSPPVIEFQAIADREVAERDEAVAIVLVLTNKSAASVRVIDVSGYGSAFAVGTLAINSDLPAFQTQTKDLKIKPYPKASFTSHKISLVVRYAWMAGEQQFISSQTATITVEVRRRFEEEAKGFPGGSAAFLYLLLPILPAMLGYQMLERLRNHEGLKLPTFGSDQIVPAFLLAAILGLLILAVEELEQGINYSDPRVFLKVLAGSFAIGALIPAVRWCIALVKKLIWGFKDGDSEASYLRKALKSARSPDNFVWATCKVGEQDWAGMLFEQPDKTPVLGPRLAVTKAETVTAAEWEEMRALIFGDQDKLVDAKYLAEQLEAGRLSVTVSQAVTAPAGIVVDVVAVTKVKGLQVIEPTVRGNLVLPVN